MGEITHTNQGITWAEEDDKPYELVGELLKPDLFLWADNTEGGGPLDEHYINLAHVIYVRTWGGLVITMVNGEVYKTSDEETIERFWEQWQLS